MKFTFLGLHDIANTREDLSIYVSITNVDQLPIPSINYQFHNIRWKRDNVKLEEISWDVLKHVLSQKKKLWKNYRISTRCWWKYVIIGKRQAHKLSNGLNTRKIHIFSVYMKQNEKCSQKFRVIHFNSFMLNIQSLSYIIDTECN